MKVCLVHLGCDKNLVDSEHMLGILADKGYEIVADENEADIIIVNTCAFILDAKEESINTLIEMGRIKQENGARGLIACGCLAQRYAAEIHEDIPEVDAVIGTQGFDELPAVIQSILEGHPQDSFGDIDNKLICGKRRVLSGGTHIAYLKIAEGCDKRCTYCAIPSIRGGFRSVPMEILLNEAEQLAEQGVRELVLVAQETTVYGKDLYGHKALSELLHKLCGISGIEWIRLLYCYPEEIDDELIDTIKTEKKICHYLDMPIQHADDTILQRMGRRTNRKYLENLISKLRSEIPDIALRTSLITGFPGEDDEAFAGLYEFVEQMRFERLGVFTFSEEEGTIAAQMDNQVEESVKQERRDRIMQLQQKICFENAAAMVGRRLPVIIEGRIPEEGTLVGRTYMDAPDVDGYVFIESDRDIDSGRIMDVIITAGEEYDLIGEFEDEFTK